MITLPLLLLLSDLLPCSPGIAEKYAAGLLSGSYQRRLEIENELGNRKEAAIQEILLLLQHPSPDVSVSGVRILRKVSHATNSRKFFQLIANLKNSDRPYVRAAYYWILKDRHRIGYEEIVAALGDPSPSVDFAVLSCLGSIDPGFDPQPILSYLAKLSPRHPLVPLCLNGLYRSAKPHNPDILFPYLQSPSTTIAASAVRTLGAWKDPLAAGNLAALAFKATDQHLSELCFIALARLGPPGMIEITRKADSRNANTRLAAAHALRFFPKSLKTLFVLLSGDPYALVQQEASRSMQHIMQLTENADYFFQYDASQIEKQAVISKWQEFLENHH